MPRPPILPLLDWPVIHASGATFEEWLACGESENNRRAMANAVETLRLEPAEQAALAALSRPVHVVAIAEDWCGDVVRHVPVLQRLATASPLLDVRFLTRDQYPEVFVRFLTNGGEAIPKFIFLSEKFVECGHWGPMPEACRLILSRGKACGDVGTARQKVSALYQADADCRAVVEELMNLIATASCSTP